MAGLTALTLMDLATLSSAIGTLGLAITSWYQMSQSRRDSLHPIVYAESVWLDLESGSRVDEILHKVRINIKNYGTGPALNLQFGVQASVGTRAKSGVPSAVHPVPIEVIMKAGQSVPYMNLAPNQEVSVELVLESSAIGPRADGPLIIDVYYRTVFRQRLNRAFTVESLNGLAVITNVAGTK